MTLIIYTSVFVWLSTGVGAFYLKEELKKNFDVTQNLMALRERVFRGSNFPEGLVVGRLPHQRRPVVTPIQRKNPWISQLAASGAYREQCSRDQLSSTALKSLPISEHPWIRRLKSSKVPLQFKGSRYQKFPKQEDQITSFPWNIAQITNKNPWIKAPTSMKVVNNFRNSHLQGLIGQKPNYITSQYPWITPVHSFRGSRDFRNQYLSLTPLGNILSSKLPKIRPAMPSAMFREKQNINLQNFQIYPRNQVIIPLPLTTNFLSSNFQGLTGSDHQILSPVPNNMIRKLPWLWRTKALSLANFQGLRGLRI